MFPEQLRGHVRDRGLGSGAPTRRDRARPARDQADLLRRLRRLARVRVRAQEPARQRARPERPRLRGDRRVPLARVLPGAGDTAGRCEEARAGLHPRDRERRGRGAAVLELSGADARTGRKRRGVERAPAGRARGFRPHAADERRSARRDAQRRPRLEPDRCVDGEADGPAGGHVRRRIQGGRCQQRARPMRASSPTSSERTTTSSSSRSPRRRSRSTASSGTSTSRSPTSRPLASSPSPRWLRSTSPSRSPARAPTSCSAVTGSIAPPPSLTCGSVFRRRSGALLSLLRPTAPIGCAVRSPRSPRRARPSGCSR